MSWRRSEAVREGIEAVVHGRWTTVVLLAGLTGLIAVPALADALQVQRLAREQSAWVEAGGRVLVASAPQGDTSAAGIDGIACAALDGVPGITAAVPVTRYSAPVRFAAQPARDLSLYRVTGAVVRLPGVRRSLSVHGSTAPGTLLVASAAAGPAGLRDGTRTRFVPRPAGSGAAGTRIADAPGAWISEVDDAVRRVEVVDLSVLGEEASLGVVVQAEATRVAERCVVAVEPGMVDAVRDVLGGLVGRGKEAAVVSSRITDGEFGPDFARDLRERPLRWGFLVSGAAAALLWSLVRWTRRAEDALYATVGADPWTITLIRGAEWSLAAVLAVLWGSSLVVALGAAASVPAATSVDIAVRYAVGTVVVATPLVLTGSLRRPPVLGALKDR